MKKTWLVLGLLLVSFGVLAGCTEKEEKKENTVQNETPKVSEEKKYKYENEAFRIREVNIKDGGKIAIISGEARVFEANVQYSVEDGHDILDKGFVTASVAAPEWGTFDFSIEVNPEKTHMPNSYVIIVYEESMENGEWRHQIEIPIELEK